MKLGTAIALSIIFYLGHFLLKSRLGYGSYFPDLGRYSHMPPILDSNSLEIITNTSLPPGNIAINKDNRKFFNYHPEYKKSPLKIVEMINEQIIPYPNNTFQEYIITCLSIRIDNLNRLWLLDFGNMGIKSPKLISFQLSDKIENDMFLSEYIFPSEVAGFGSMLNDFQISDDGNYIYIADTSIISTTPSLIIYNTITNKSYRLLSSHSTMYGESIFITIQRNIKNIEIKLLNTFGLTINIDSIALSRDNKSLYYGALTGNKLYCIDTQILHEYITLLETNSTTANIDNTLSSNIHLVMSNKPVTDGISSDIYGNIWMTALEYSSISIGVSSNDILYSKTLLTNEKYQSSCHKLILNNIVMNQDLLRWPDGLSFGPGTSLLHMLLLCY
jgi:sugar lactone lactonase YvrE